LVVLEKLLLTGNKLATLEEVSHLSKSTDYIFIQYFKVSAWPQTSLLLDLTSNELVCNCALRWFFDDEAFRLRMMPANNLGCQGGPILLSLTPWVNLTLDDICPCKLHTLCIHTIE
jgi:hypothetical protein